MSQHTLNIETRAGRPVLVQAGWDQSHGGFYLVVQDERLSKLGGRFIYSNLTRPENDRYPECFDCLEEVLASLGIVVPPEMLDEIREDGRARAGLKRVVWTPGGSRHGCEGLERLPGQPRRERTTCSCLAEGLPELAYVANEWDKSPGAAPVYLVRRGESGYWPVYTKLTADELNAELGVSEAQREAMYTGSLFGWHTPGADPQLQEALIQRRKQRQEGIGLPVQEVRMQRCGRGRYEVYGRAGRLGMVLGGKDSWSAETGGEHLGTAPTRKAAAQLVAVRAAANGRL